MSSSLFCCDRFTIQQCRKFQTISVPSSFKLTICSDYAAKVFGFATFGRVYGCIIALSGLVNLAQPLIDAMNHEVFDDNTVPINVFLASLGSVFGTSLVVYVWAQSRRIDKEYSALEYEWDRFRMIPEEDEITELEI